MLNSPSGYLGLTYRYTIDSLTDENSQLVIMNACSFIGRLTPSVIGTRLGIDILTMVCFAAGGGAVLILCMIALKTLASVVILSVLYGLCAGVCAYSSTSLCSFRTPILSTR